MQTIETEAAAAGPLPPVAAAGAGAAARLRLAASSRRCCSGMIVGSWVLITINTLIFGFVICSCRSSSCARG